MTSDQSKKMHRDEPRSFVELAKDLAKSHSYVFYGIAAISFGFFTLLTISLLYHNYVGEVPLLVEASKHSGEPIPEHSLTGLVFSLIVYSASFLASIYGLVTRGDRNV